MKAVRKYCLDCCCGSALEVRECPIKDCHLFKGRFGKGRITLKTIRKNCIDCSETVRSIRTCELTACSLWPYRMGHRPKIGEKTALVQGKTLTEGIVATVWTKERSIK